VRLGDVADLPPTLDGRQYGRAARLLYWSLLEQVKVGCAGGAAEVGPQAALADAGCCGRWRSTRRTAGEAT